MVTTRTRMWTSRVVRVVLSALGGAALAYGFGQAALFLTGSCTVLCDPSVSVPLGGTTGVLAFWNVGRG